MNITTVLHYLPVGEAPTAEQLTLDKARARTQWSDHVTNLDLVPLGSPVVHLTRIPDLFAVRVGEPAILAYGQARRPHGKTDR